MIKQKSCHIETLRGIAILLVVLGHVIGSTSEGGMKVANDSFFRYLYDLFVNIRMPLFTVISGWVYALHPVKADNISIFLRKKVRRLLFPMVFVGSLYFLLQYFIPGTNNKMVLPDIWKIYIFPYSIYWYLPALFLVFIGIAICDIRKYLNTISRWYILMIVSCLLCYSELTGIIPRSVPNYFAFKNAFYLSPFFLTGVGIVRFKERLSSPVMLKIYLAGLIIGIVLQQMNFFYPHITTFYTKYHLSIIIGILSSSFLVNLKLNNRFFIWLAQYAYTIYLYHGFGTSGGRIILSGIGIQNEFFVFLFAGSIATFCPILVEKVCKKWKISSRLFLGTVPHK